MKKIVSIMLITLLLFPSCATIIQSGKQKVGISATPPDATIIIDGVPFMGGQGARIPLKRKKNHTIIIKKEGYETQTIFINKDLQVGYIVLDTLLVLS